MLRRWGACQCQRILWVKASQSHWPTNEAKRPKTRAPYSKPTDMILIYFDDSLWVSFVRCLLSSCRDQVADSLAKEKTWINWKSQISQWKKNGAQSYQCPSKKHPATRWEHKAKFLQSLLEHPQHCQICWAASLLSSRQVYYLPASPHASHASSCFHASFLPVLNGDSLPSSLSRPSPSWNVPAEASEDQKTLVTTSNLVTTVINLPQFALGTWKHIQLPCTSGLHPQSWTPSLATCQVEWRSSMRGWYSCLMKIKAPPM